MLLWYFSTTLDAFPKSEVDGGKNSYEAESNLPSNSSHFVESVSILNLQHPITIIK